MKVTAEKGILTIELPLAKPDDAPPSASGKTKMLATSNGFVGISGAGLPDGFKLSINGTIPNPEYKADDA